MAHSGRSALASGVDAAANAVTGPQAAAVVYTSGTTGRPKGAVLPHHGFTATYAIQNRRWLSGAAERAPVVEPINHVAAVGDESFALIAAGGTAVYLEQFDAERLLQLIEDERITFWYTDPAILGLCVRSPRWRQTNFTSLRRVVWSGGRAPLPLVRELRKLGVALGTSWGMTETIGSATYTDDDAGDDVLASTLGRPDPAYEVKVVADDAAPSRRGDPGELCVRNPHLMIGYFGRPEATKEVIDDDGWLHTGDLVVERPDGNLELVGRLSDMFKSGGENIHPREVEQVLEAHPAVAAAVVVARGHEVWGEVGHAYVVSREPVNVETLRAHAGTHLARYKVPKTFEIVADLPMLPSGKVDRRALTSRAAADPNTHPNSDQRTEMAR
jgi:acyl-CoA synthetase (AMP-forming)/AMP-acid ligase II